MGGDYPNYGPHEQIDDKWTLAYILWSHAKQFTVLYQQNNNNTKEYVQLEKENPPNKYGFLLLQKMFDVEKMDVRKHLPQETRNSIKDLPKQMMVIQHQPIMVSRNDVTWNVERQESEEVPMDVLKFSQVGSILNRIFE